VSISTAFVHARAALRRPLPQPKPHVAAFSAPRENSDGSRLFQVVDTSFVKLGSIVSFKAKIEALFTTPSFAPGTFVLSSLLVAGTNTSKAKLIRYAVPDTAGGQNITVPDDKWLSEKWAIKHGLYCKKTSLMTDRAEPFFL
jgi:hypothetical protein